METDVQETALNVEDELKKLREKSDRGELAELKRGPFGSYRSKEVAQYVTRLKEQLQTSEKTFKSHIAELSGEKDDLKAERDALKAKLAAYEAAAQANGAPAAPKHRAPAKETEPKADEQANAALASLQAKTESLENELKLAEQRYAGLLTEKNDLQAQFADLAGGYGLKAEEYMLRIHDLEERLAEDQNLAEEYERQLDDQQRKLERFTEEGKLLRSQLADLRQENCRVIIQSDSLTKELDGLTSQLEVAKQNILGLISDKEALEGVNSQLKDALNRLIVKADALIRENSQANSRLDAERAKTQQSQAMHEKLSDMLAKVRAAGQMLDERVLELDKALCWGDGRMARPARETPRRVSRTDLLDFRAGRSDALQEIVSELDAIQMSMDRLEQPLPLGEDAFDGTGILVDLDMAPVAASAGRIQIHDLME